MRPSNALLVLLLFASALLHGALIAFIDVAPPLAEAVRLAPPAGGSLRVRLVTRPAEGGPVLPAPATASADLAPGSAARGGPASPDGLVLPFVPAPDAAYLTRSQLTQPPEPAAPIVIPDPGPAVLPDRALASVRLVLSVFINEHGHVERLRIETPDVPAALEQAARKAFQNARFVPGEVDGRPVKSRLRVEVGFEVIGEPGGAPGVPASGAASPP